MKVVVVVVSDVWSIHGSKSTDHYLSLVFQCLKFHHILRQQEAEWLEAGLERPWFEREVISVPHDTLQGTLSYRHTQEV